MESSPVMRKPAPILLEHGKEVLDLISPATTISGGDSTIDIAGPNTSDPIVREPQSTIDPRVILYGPAYPACTEKNNPLGLAVGQNADESTSPLYPLVGNGNMLESLQKESMFVSTLATDKETVASSGEAQ